MQPNISKNVFPIFKATFFCIVFTGLMVVFSFAKNFLPHDFERLAHGIVGMLAGLIATWIFVKLDKKSFLDMELFLEKNTIKHFLVGVLIGIILMGFLAVGVMYFTHVNVELNPKYSILGFLFATAPLIPMAFMEELGFRAYPLQILKGGIGIRGAIAITSVLFALYHVANGWTVTSAFLGPAVWGLIFGLAAIYSKGIAMPTGIHYAANLTTSAFGASDNPTSIWRVTAENVVGGAPYGIDWSIILPAIILLIGGVIAIEYYTRRKNTAN